MTLYDTLVENQYMENAYFDWKEYRESLTLYLKEQIPKGRTVAILGAGMCNDIDLDLLIDHVKELFLVDKMKINHVDIFSHYTNANKKKEKVKFLEMDFVGITQEEYRIFSERLIQLVQIEKERTNIKDLAKMVSLHMKELYQKALKREIFATELSFDYIIAVGLHSQLNNLFAWMWEEVLRSLAQTDSFVFQFIASYNEQFIKKFHDKLLKYTVEGIIIGCEIQRVGKKDLIQGSIQAFDDINQRIAKNELICIDQAYIYWPFDITQEIVFDVELRHLKVNSQN